MVLNDAVAYWALEDTTDSSGNGYTLTNNGATSGVSAKLNNGYSFNGSTNYLSSGVSISGTGDSSYSVWIKWDGGTANPKAIMGTYTSGGSVGTTLLVNTSGTIIYQGGSGSAVSSPISSGVWYHIVGTRNSTGTKLYLNGVEVASTTGTPSTTETSTISIGRSGDYNGWYFDGDIDEVAVYNRELSSTEVSDLYNGGTGFNPYAPTGYANKVNGVTASKVNGIDVANVSKVNGI